MLPTFRDMLARAERKMRSHQRQRGLPELHELGADMVRRVGVLDEEGRMRECLRVAIRTLAGAGLCDEALAALSGEGSWVTLFLRVLAVGEKGEVWSATELCDGVKGPLAPVWSALKAQGSASVMAVYLARFREKTGDAELRCALREIGWESGATRQPAASGERRQKPVSAPGGDGPFKTLWSLNVNQHTGERTTDGWYDPESDELVLLRSRIGGFYEVLKTRGLLLSAWKGAKANGHVFEVRAGARTFRNAVAVDLKKLREEAPAEVEAATARWITGAIYPVAPKTSKATDVDIACPGCGAGLQRKAGTHGMFFVCKGRGCGFSAQATDDGGLPKPEPCEECGGDRFRTMKKGRFRLVHVGTCKKGKVLRMPQPAASG